MIAFLTGRVAGRGVGYALLDVGGVGYRLLMSSASLAALPAKGDEVTVLTHLHVREDELTLFGFENQAEQEAFAALMTVSGVGPKLALAVLSTLTPDELAGAIATEDVAAVSAVPGVGRKTAQRIIVDLADRLGRVGEGGATQPGTASGALVEAREALLAMGFSAAEISVALKGAPQADSSGLLRFALARLGRGE